PGGAHAPAGRCPASRVGVPKAVRTRVWACSSTTAIRRFHITWCSRRLSGWLALIGLILATDEHRCTQMASPLVGRRATHPSSSVFVCGYFSSLEGQTFRNHFRSAGRGGRIKETVSRPPWQDGGTGGQSEIHMTVPEARLDDVVSNARDAMDRAADLYRRLGFALTERGYHSLGSINHLAMFGTDYLELIAVPKGATSGRLDLLDYPVGLNGLVFGSEDSTVTYNELAKAGVPVDPPVEFTRPVKADGQAHDARFRTVRMKPGVVPYGRIYYCHHFTRDLVWRDEWRHHDNGVVAVVRALIVEPDPAKGAKLYADMFGREAVRDIKGGK